MLRICATVLLLTGAVVAVAQTPKKRGDYVPDEKTAARIAEAVLVAQYGEAISARFPLLVDGTNKDFWILQVREEPGTKGGGPAVWINKHTGCMNVMEHMK